MTAAATKRPSSKRELLVETALRLFHDEGYHATGIDRILAEAGVAKMTLYKHFASKDDLIIATAEQRKDEFSNFFDAYIKRNATSPRETLLAYFAGLEEWFAGRAFPNRPFRGCMFINASAEFPKAEAEIRRIATESKRRTRSWLQRISEEAGARDPAALASQLSLLAEGAIVTAQVGGDMSAATDARCAAEALIRDQVSGG